MKTLGRILIILIAFALVMGLTYMAVNAGGSPAGSNASVPGRGRGFPGSGGARPEFRGEGGARGGGWMFGMIKNIGIIAVIVAMVVIPKNIGRKRIRSVSASAG